MIKYIFLNSIAQSQPTSSPAHFDIKLFCPEAWARKNTSGMLKKIIYLRTSNFSFTAKVQCI